jgi:hypothetical protein
MMRRKKSWEIIMVNKARQGGRVFRKKWLRKKG